MEGPPHSRKPLETAMLKQTRTQVIYAALDRAITGPKNGDPRRDGTSEDRLQYLTDAVEAALKKWEQT